MRTSDCDILIVPGLDGSGPDHWQTRWEAKLSTARRVHQPDRDTPGLDARAARLAAAIGASTRPVVLVAHGLGTHVVAHAAPALGSGGANGAAGRVVGAFLVAPPDLEDAARTPALQGVRVPPGPLGVAGVLIASRTDPHCRFERAEAIAAAWGAPLVDAGDAGHIDAEAGFGPWPEGLMRFAGFLKTL